MISGRRVMASTTGTAFDRDSRAKWYARRHLDIDDGVVQILYLPTNAPPREIRFLEVNRMISETTPPEPIDFGVDIGGADAHTLYVLDVTPAQWEALQKGAMPLPVGWTLDGSQELGRRDRS
jgi:hypothetical protein